MKIPLKFWMMIAIGFTVAACDSGGSGGGSDATAPTLGITSVQKVGATAIPNSNVASKPSLVSAAFTNVASKPSLVSAAFTKVGRFSFRRGVAFAAHCPDPSLFVTSFAVDGGKVWIKEAYAILDEVEFENEPSTDSPEVGPFALDLTNTDDNVGQAINVNVPSGNYSSIKFRIKRVEDAPAPILNVTDTISFRDKLLDGSKKRRPSIYIAGTIEATASDTCNDFIFIADHRWEVRIPFQSGSTGSTAVEAVLLFDLEGAIKLAMTTSVATAQSLIGEIGAGTVDIMGAQFLDGRTKDPDHGTPIAKAITAALPLNMKVFVQSSGSMDDNPTGTVIDDSAVRVSGDDNPSVSDLAETPG